MPILIATLVPILMPSPYWVPIEAKSQSGPRKTEALGPIATLLDEDLTQEAKLI